MALTTRKKLNVIKEHALHETDTGSANVQIGILTRKIEDLTGHLKKNKKDEHSRRGLLQMVSQRRKLLKYLEANDPDAHKKIVKKLERK